MDLLQIVAYLCFLIVGFSIGKTSETKTLKYKWSCPVEGCNASYSSNKEDSIHRISVGHEYHHGEDHD